MMHFRFLVPALVLLGACGSKPRPNLFPAAQPLTEEQIQARWNQALAAFRTGSWKLTRTTLERLLPELPPGDPRRSKGHFYLGECYFATHDNLQAVREFRRVADETPNDRLAPDALLRTGDAYAELWKRPELDPTYGETAMGTYQELLNRYPGTIAADRAQIRMADLREQFAIKLYKAALFYVRLKAWDSAILYLRDVVATYPKSSVAPEALVKLVKAYKTIGYQEDLQETCGYIRRFHPDARGADEYCPESPAPGTT